MGLPESASRFPQRDVTRGPWGPSESLGAQSTTTSMTAAIGPWSYKSGPG